MAWRLSQRDHIQSNSRPHFVIRSCCWLAPNCCWWWNTVFCSVDFKDMIFNLLTLCYLTKKIPRAKNGGKTVRKQMTRNFFSSNHKVDILNYVIWRVNRTQCDVGICGGGMALSSPMVTFASIKYHMTVKTWQRKRLVSSTIAKDDSRE